MHSPGVGNRRLSLVVLAAIAMGACGDGDGVDPGDTGRRRDARTDGVAGDSTTTDPDAGAPGPCVDEDNDGIANGIDGLADDDRDGIPNFQDPDTDGDGFNDIDEAVGNYPNFNAMRPTLTCGQGPDDCDMDGTANFRDTDSDNDGLTDAEELTARTNPCAADTDGDGIDDLTERAAMSDPTSNTSMPPTGSLYVVLPYHPPGDMAMHVHREFTFSTRLRAADIFFVVDTTGSMGATISAVRSTLNTVIVPGIVAALGPMGDARYGMAAHGDFANGGTNSDGCMTRYQSLNRNAALTQAATGRLTANGGGDGPESMVPAMHALISGFGLPGYGGTATRMVNPPVDCGTGPDSPVPYGWGCFEPGRVPIIVLFSDAPWHNGPAMASTNFYSSVPGAATYDQLVTELVRRGAYFVGIDVGGGSTFANSRTLAMVTRTLDGMGNPIAFMGAPSTIAANVVNAITTIAGSSRQDITTRTDPDRMEMRLTMGHTTGDFIKAVTPARGIPPAPMGYMRHDMTTFYDVIPSTQVVFDVDFYNDFQPGGRTATLFRATIVVLGRARSEVDRRDVFIIVPADGGTLPG